MRWMLVVLCSVLAGCASNNAGTKLTGDRYDVVFSTQETAKSLEIECAPPSTSVPKEWIDECNAIARRYLGTLVARGRIADFPDPAFGQAGQAMKGIWAGLAKNDGGIGGSGRKIALTLSRDMAWDELQ